SVSASSLVPCSNKILKARKTQPVSNVGFSGHVLPSTNVRPSSVLPPKVVTSFPRGNEVVVPPPSISTIPPPLCSMEFSPSKSDGVSVSMDETMSTCDSFKSPEVEYMDNRDVTAIDSIERKTFSNLYISDHLEATGNICNRDAIAEMETDDKIIDVDDNYVDPQFCATFACDIYKHLRASEVKKRPSTDFMERIQKDINSSMRAILIDWLVEVAEEYRLVPDTLYLTVNYIDRYLSGNVMNRQRLQLLGVACMMIAAKYEEICAPQVEEFCYITDNTYFKEEVLEMESSVLNYLKFEMTAATAKCFLRILPCSITHFTSPLICVTVLRIFIDYAVTIKILLCLQSGRNTINISTNVLQRSTALPQYLQNSSRTKCTHQTSARLFQYFVG
ncbi:Cyclin A1,1 isoform 2, partial [Theobroma cacao]